MGRKCRYFCRSHDDHVMRPATAGLMRRVPCWRTPTGTANEQADCCSPPVPASRARPLDARAASAPARKIGLSRINHIYQTLRFHKITYANGLCRTPLEMSRSSPIEMSHRPRRSSRPGLCEMPTGSVSSFGSLGRGGTAVSCIFRSDHEATCLALRLFAHPVTVTHRDRSKDR